MQPTAIPDFRLSHRFAGAEEDGAAEDPTESVGQTAVVRSVLRQSPLVQNLTGTLELDRPALLAHGLGGNPQRDQSILSERQAVVRMADDLEEEAPVPPRMPEGAVNRTADWEPTQDEGAGAEGNLLPPLVPLLPDEADRLNFSSGYRGRGWLVREWADEFPKTRACVFEHGRVSGYRGRIAVVKGRGAQNLNQKPLMTNVPKRNCCSECCSISAVETRIGRTGGSRPPKESAI